MKNKLLAVLATFGMVASASAVKINNNLSINGFIDGSWVSSDSGAANDDVDLDIDEVELNFIFNAGNVSGELHIDDNDDDANIGSIEQVHFTYGFSNGINLQVGRFGSDLGLEREDPAGLYTFSRAYGSEIDVNPAPGVATNRDLFNLGNVDSLVGEGVRVSYAADKFTASFAAYNAQGAAEESSAGVGSQDDLDYELALTFTGIDNVVIGGGAQGQRSATDNDDTDTVNIYATYTLDKLLLGAEYVNADSEQLGDDLTAYSLLADYDINDQLGIAVRYSEWETSANEESDQLTIAPNYALTSSLGAILEYSSTEDSDGEEVDTLALELTFTF